MYHNGGRNGGESLRAAWQEVAAEAQPWLLKLLAQHGAPVAARYAFWKERLQRLRPGQRRALQRRLGVSLAGAALLLALSGGTVGASPAAAITVSGACDLIEAIGNANDTTTGQPNTDCAAGNPAGADTIYLTANVTLTASNNSTFGPTGLPVVTSAITIEGDGNTISRSSASNFRILAVGSGGNLTLNNATISGGRATNASPGDKGGGIYARSATLAVSNSTLSGNSASSRGGGIYANSATLAVSNSTLSSNSTANGGGIWANAATVTVSNSTLSGNAASTGGGVWAGNSTLTVSNSTFAGNSAPTSGPGIFRSAGAVTVSNSIIALHSGSDCNTALTSGGYNIESATSCGFNLGSDLQSVTSGALNLGALAPNGGPTQTRALSSPSVAIDQIPDGVNGCAAGVSTDQRGAVRADGASRGGAGCDVGAYEYDSNQKPTAVTLRSLSAAGGSGGAPVGWWGAVLAGLGGLGLSAFFARRQGWRRQGPGHSASALPYSAPPAPPYSAPPLAAPLAVEAATLADASAPAYTPPAISSRGQLKQFAGSPLVVDPLALPDP